MKILAAQRMKAAEDPTKTKPTEDATKLGSRLGKAYKGRDKWITQELASRPKRPAKTNDPKEQWDVWMKSPTALKNLARRLALDIRITGEKGVSALVWGVFNGGRSYQEDFWEAFAKGFDFSKVPPK